MIGKDIGIDLGTANVLIYVKGQGIILNEPSVIAIEKETQKVLAVGEDANKMLGRTPGKIDAIRPLKDGVIADFELTVEMLRIFLEKVKAKGLIIKPKIVICCPVNITKVEKNAIKEAAENIGARKVYVEEEPKVAAIGSGIDISLPEGNMVIDIGGGTTDIAILSLGDIVTSRSLKIAGDVFNQDIIKYIKNKYKLLIGEKTAEDIKIKIGNVLNEEKVEKIKVKGRDLSTGLPNTINFSSKEVEEALKESLREIIYSAKNVLEETQPELSADIVENGITITGGGALLKNISKLFKKELNVPIKVSKSPLTSVVDGTAIMLENISLI